MLGLYRSLVEHPLPIKLGFKPHRQLFWRMSLNMINRVKEKIERLLEYGFIKLMRYSEWMSNTSVKNECQVMH
jgi:hypothetical protein